MTITEFQTKYAFVHNAIATAFPGADIADCLFDFDMSYAVCFQIEGYENCFRCEHLSNTYEVLELDEVRLQELIDETRRLIKQITG